METAPPALEFEEAIAAAFGVGEEVIIFAEEIAPRVEHFEIADEPGAVEDAVAEIGEQQRRRRPAEQSAVVSHRIFAQSSRPGGEWRAIDDERAGDVGIGGGERHGRPAALTIADDDGLRRLRMAPRDLANELGLGVRHVGDRLPRLGFWMENDEIDRVAIVQGDADLAVGLEASDSGAVAGARIDDHIGALPIEHLHAFRRQDPQQEIVDGPSQTASVENDFRIIDEHGRRARGLVLLVVVGALPEDVERQHPALRRVDGVDERVVEKFAFLAVRLAGANRLARLGP